ncbi:MAG: hypothetical protein KKF41_06250 [Actinobacteria bacterium]|nr:hypothetical protein [Actinomycetota bacterium]MBU1942063.1 hypothetical protein [Actinomycetota bacterium]MBU2687166.1 hypothetical protein [Actinomycetota bacterium]
MTHGSVSHLVRGKPIRIAATVFLAASLLVLAGVSPAASAVTQTWYLAEGSTAWGFATYITLENPSTVPGNATIEYMTLAGTVTGPTVYLPGQSELTVFPSDTLGAQDFSTRVTTDLPYPIAVDRTMYWPSGFGTGFGYHSSIGVMATGSDPLPMRWYLPEGSSAWGFETWLLLQNPSAEAAHCNVTYMVEGGSPVVKEKTIPGNSRQSFSMETDIGVHDASVMVESTDFPVIAERSMYQAAPGAPTGNRREGHVSIGAPRASNDYYLAEGSTNWGFTTYILIQNPNTTYTNVVLSYNTPTGSISDPPIPVAGRSRKTIRVNDSHPNTDLSTHVVSDQPVVAERAMYWGSAAGPGSAMTDSIGMPEGHADFYFPDGEVYSNTATGDLTETFTCVQNPNSTDVKVAVSYFTADGGLFAWTETIPAQTRRTYNLADKIAPDNRAAIKVECRTAGKKIMCERSMYFQRRWSGANTIGGTND